MYIPKFVIQMIVCVAIYCIGRGITESYTGKWSNGAYWTGWAFMAAWYLLSGAL